MCHILRTHIWIWTIQTATILLPTTRYPLILLTRLPHFLPNWLLCRWLCECRYFPSLEERLKNDWSKIRIKFLNCLTLARFSFVEIALNPLRKSPTTRSFPSGGLITSPVSSVLSPPSTHKIYAKAIGISRVSLHWWSVKPSIGPLIFSD